MDSPERAARRWLRPCRRRIASLGVLLLGLLPALAGGRPQASPEDAAVPAMSADAPVIVAVADEAGRDESSFAVRHDSAWRYRGIGDLAGITLGVTADYSYFPEVDDWIARNQENPERIDIATGESPLHASLRKLQSQRIDAFIENRNVLLYVASQHRTRVGIRLEGRIAGSDTVVGFSPSADSDPTLAGIFDERLRQMRESGELGAILARYGLDDWAKGTTP